LKKSKKNSSSLSKDIKNTVDSKSIVGRAYGMTGGRYPNLRKKPAETVKSMWIKARKKIFPKSEGPGELNKERGGEIPNRGGNPTPKILSAGALLLKFSPLFC